MPYLHYTIYYTRQLAVLFPRQKNFCKEQRNHTEIVVLFIEQNLFIYVTNYSVYDRVKSNSIRVDEAIDSLKNRR